MNEQIIIIDKPILLSGYTMKTSNEMEFDSSQAKIPQFLGQYFARLSANIQHKVSSGTTYCAYFDYQDKADGLYSYFVGEAVSTENAGLYNLVIPSGKYKKITTSTGVIPAIVIEAWQKIWCDDAKLSERNFIVDFEIYDARCSDMANAIVDVVIGIK